MFHFNPTGTEPIITSPLLKLFCINFIIVDGPTQTRACISLAIGIQ